MISNKKSYAMKMLQLALALSLLHVDPDNYLQQRLRNWDSQLELRDGDGWELEMLRAVPMVEYPYANRKTMMPLIEDLIRFDRQNDHLATQYNITAYLLNVSNESSNQTAALQEMQQLPSTPTTNSAASGSTTTTTASASLDPSTVTVSSVVTAPGATNASHLNNFPTSEIELFLNSENFQDQRSVWEQNLADLNDFNDLPIMNSQYGNLPLKDGQQDNNLFDLQLDAFLPTFGSSAATAPTSVEGAVALNDTFPNPDEGAGIKLEQLDDEDDKALLIGVIDTRTVSALSTDEQALAEFNVKKEPEDSNSDNDNTTANNSEVDLSPFINTVELTKEESEIVEVLWKQDVDLGYSLTPAQLAEADASAKALQQQSTVNDDDIEKLKALEALKLDNGKYDPKDIDNDDHLGNEWAGIPFTIDNETGEYIRLPLDEILNDVIQFAELAGEDEDTGASTSKAAAANSKNHLKSKKEEEDNNQDSNSTASATKTETDFDEEFKSEGDFKDDLNGEDDKKKKKKKNKKKYNNGIDDEKDNNKSNDNNNKHKINSDDEVGNDDEDDDDDEDSDLPQSEIEVNSLPSPLFDLDDEAKEELADLSMMLHSSAPFAPHHHPHHPHHPHAHARAGGAGAAAGGVGAVQNYGSVNSAFHRQPSSGGFHPGHHQGRMPLSRTVSMEHRFQDIASLFNPMGVVGGVSDISPYSHYSTHPYTYQTGPQHAQYPPPPPPPHPHHHHAAAMLHPNASLGDLCSTQPHYGHNLGSAVSSSMHLTNSSHETDVSGVGAGAVGGSAYKMEHDMMYYSNASSDMNHTTDGFINSILNDEDLHLMDMNVNDSFCRMVDVNNSTSNNSSVLGIPSGHGNTASGSASGSTSGLSMSSSNIAGAAGASGMTSDLMNSAATQGGTDRLDASSDSAVSSMGSERVPSLSDGEWGEGSDSAQDYHQGKYGGPYDYSYNNTTNNRLNDGTRQPPVAQKKHHMFGKRFLNEQPGVNTANANPAVSTNDVINGPAHSIKYEYEPYPSITVINENSLVNGLEGGAMGGPTLSKEHHAYGGAYSLDFSMRTPRTPHEIVQHNHTYTLPQGTGSLPRPQQRDKKTSISSSSTKSSKSAHNSSGSGGEEENYLTRDEKRARAMNIPIPVTDIINLPMDEFNERLSKYDLSENQLSLIRDIRRRGKNKVAAQNCRKRKLDQILSLEDEVKQVRRRKEDLQAQRERLFNERKRVSNKFGALHRHIFQYLRDSDGNPCSPAEYSLQQAADGSIYLLPRDTTIKNETNGVLHGSHTTNGSSQPHHPQMSQNSHVAALHHHHLPQQATTAAVSASSMAHNHAVQHHHHQQQQQHHHQPATQGQPTHNGHHQPTQHGGTAANQQKD